MSDPRDGRSLHGHQPESANWSCLFAPRPEDPRCGLPAALAFALGLLSVGALLLAALVVWLAGSFVGERLEHGPRRKGGGL